MTVGARRADRFQRRCLTLLCVGAFAVSSGAAPMRPAAASDAAPAPGVAHPSLWPAGTPGLLLKPATEQFIAQLLAHMSLEDKVGQMIQADIDSITPEQLHQYRLGSVLAGGNAAPHRDVRSSPQDWLALMESLHRAALEPGDGAHVPIPLLFGIDAVHGNAKVRGATIFPHNIGLGAAHDPELIERIGRATADEVAVTGIDWVFAPTVAVGRDPRWGRIYESYSEDPQLVARYAASMVSGLQGRLGTLDFMASGHTVASVKHFLGDGGTRDGRDQGDTAVSESQLIRVHAPGYLTGIKAGALIVMVSYNTWQGVKMHGNASLLTDVLKQRLGFDGLVASDWNAVEELPGCSKYSCAAAFRAGIDLMMAPDGWRQFYDNTLAQVRAGEIPAARVDDAVRRILRVKALAGLFERPPPGLPGPAGQFADLGSAEHRALAREAVRKSLVLLKNEHQLLPLDPHAHLLVIGAAADDIGRQSGGWSIDWQGDHNRNEDFPGATSILAGLRDAVAAAGGSLVYSADGSFADKPDAAIVVFGEKPYAEFEGDRETLDFASSDAATLAVLRRLRAQSIPTVAVLLSGRPLWVNPELNAADAFVAAWLPGSEGEGVADVLLRAPDGSVRYDFSGRLSFSWPATGMPARFADADSALVAATALFPRGTGLRAADRTHVATLSEDPRLPRDRGSADMLYAFGHVVAPFSIFVADSTAQVRLTSRRQPSPGGAVIASVDGGAARIQWTGTSAGTWFIADRPQDLRAREAEALQLRLRIDQRPPDGVRLGLICAPDSDRSANSPGDAAAGDAAQCGVPGGAMIDLSRALDSGALGRWQTLTVPLSCLSARGARLANVAAPVAIRSRAPFDLHIATVRFVHAPAHCPD